jgi:starvation-inducible DNA-binding protein
MIKHLVAAQEATARKLFPLANAANDQPIADLLTQRLEVHEKPRGCCAACWKAELRKL